MAAACSLNRYSLFLHSKDGFLEALLLFVPVMVRDAFSHPLGHRGALELVIEELLEAHGVILSSFCAARDRNRFVRPSRIMVTAPVSQ
jgi:hypothetical protein